MGSHRERYKDRFFLFYMQYDIMNSSNILHKVIFADDTNLFLSHKNLEHLQNLMSEELIKVDTWFKCNKFALYINKTNFIVFHSNRNRNNVEHIRIEINDRAVERVESIKFLGIYIDEFLNFKKHIDELTKKLSKYVGLFFKLRHFLPVEALLTLYRSLFESHLNYCNVIWSNTYPSYLKKLQLYHGPS